mgnify:CR=1 FL=1
MINEKYDYNSISHRSLNSYKDSIKSNITNKNKNTGRKKKNIPNDNKVDYSKSGIDLSNYSKTKEQIYCSFCQNQIMKSGLYFSCKHISCSNCLCREILKVGINEIQNKNIDGSLIIECPCKSGKLEIAVQNLNSLLYIDEECLNHGEFQSCSKCSLWSSVLTQMKQCTSHNNIMSSRNINDNIIKDYCLDCKKGLCLFCKEEFHNGHKIKTIENMVNDIHNIKLKNQNYKEWLKYLDSLENKFKKEYDKEFNSNVSKLDEIIQSLNKIRNDYIEKMKQKLLHSRNVIILLKYIYYFYYKDLATVKNDVKVIEFLNQSKYEMQNISFSPRKGFSTKIQMLYQALKDVNVETFEFELNVKNIFLHSAEERYQAHGGIIFDLLNIDNKYLLSAGEDKKIKIWSLNPMRLLNPIETYSLGHETSVFCLCKENNGKRFFSGAYGEIKIWSTLDFSLINILYGHKDFVSHLEIIQKIADPYKNNEYKDFLCSSSYDNTIKIWDIDSLNCIYTLSGHTNRIHYLIQTKPGFIISCSSDKTIKFWNLEEENCYLSLKDAHDGPIYSLIESIDGKIVSSSFNSINIYDFSTQKFTELNRDKNKGVFKLLILPDNKLISSSFKYINFWNLNNYQWLYEIEAHNSYINSLLIVKDKLISGGNDGDIKAWE